MYSCDVDQVSICYRKVGEGLPLIVLHGRAADNRVAMSMIETLFESRSGWLRIYPDLPGMGRTAGRDNILSQDDMLEVVTGFIAAVTDKQPFALAGVSYGGYLAQGIVHNMAERLAGLLLVVPSVERNSAKQDFPQHRVIYADPAFDAALKPEEHWLRDAVVVQTPAVLEQVREELLPALALADTAFLERIERVPELSFDAARLPTPCTAPTLILAGRQDSVTGYREAWRLMEHYPRATFAVLDRAGHMLHREQRGLFRALASEWLDRVKEYVTQRPHLLTS